MVLHLPSMIRREWKKMQNDSHESDPAVCEERERPLRRVLMTVQIILPVRRSRKRAGMPQGIRVNPMTVGEDFCLDGSVSGSPAGTRT